MRNLLQSTTILTLILFTFLNPISISAQSAYDIVLPKPQSVELKSGKIVLGRNITINPTNTKENLPYIKDLLSAEFGIKLSTKDSQKADIKLIIDKESKIATEGYNMDINSKDITITASTETGIFYGLQTLTQLINSGKEGSKIEISCQEIKDSPRFEWRSFMLDESRHFSGKEAVLELLDEMSRLKMNKFHWHLTDHNGWRLEIKAYPLLTEIGSKRRDTQSGAPFDWGSAGSTGEPHEGFYTQEQIKEVLRYAKERHIQIIPEIGMPGHATAAIAAYPWIGIRKDTLEVATRWQGNHASIDVIDPKAIEFVERVLSETIDLFETDVIHIGGDEVSFLHWKSDEDLIAYKRDRGYEEWMDLQVDFTNRVSNFIASKGCSMMAWNEILRSSSNETALAKNVVVQFWRGEVSEFTKAASQGYKLVNSTHTHTYLDYLHSETPLDKSYGFNPIPEGLDKRYHKNIIGIGCQMWTEFTPTYRDVQRQVFPRIAAYAEIGWSSGEQRNFQEFLSRLQPVRERWKDMGINIGGDL